MADDSVSPPPVADNTSPAPVVPPDQITQSTDIGQQPAGTWPDSTNLANDQLPADSNSQSADTAPPSTEPNRPDSIASADSPQIPADSDQPSPQREEPVSSAPADSPPSPPLPISPSSTPESPPNLPNQTSLANPPSEQATTIQEEKPSESSVSDTDTNIISTDQQAPQVQSEAPNDAFPIDTQKQDDQLANFKPEPPEQPQEAPLANLSAETLVKEDNDSQNSTLPAEVSTKEGPKSFGDLLSSENQPQSSPSILPIPSTPSTPPISSLPPVSSPAPSVSFGDLIKDIKPEESVIQPPPIPSASSPVSPNPSPITNNPQSISFPSPISLQLDQLALRRQKANQVRSQKKKGHLDKIMKLAQNTKSISNTDVQRLLRVSQSTATNYLSELSSRGMLKRQGIRGGAKYSL